MRADTVPTGYQSDCIRAFLYSGMNLSIMAKQYISKNALNCLQQTLVMCWDKKSMKSSPLALITRSHRSLGDMGYCITTRIWRIRSVQDSTYQKTA